MRKYLQNIYLTKNVHPKCVKNLYNSKYKQPNSKLENDLNSNLKKGDIQVAEYTKKVLNIFIHKGNANLSHNKIPLQLYT